MKKPKVTVIIAVLNMKGTIKKCINSVLDNDYKDMKILVGDGYSTDGTYEILKGFEDIGLIELIQSDKLVNNQWNEALKVVDTEYIAFTDADCVVDKEWLTNLMEGFEENKRVIATAGFCGTPKTDSWLQQVIGKELEARFNKFPKYITRAPTMNLCVKAKYAKRVGFHKELNTSSEVVFGWELSKLGKILYVPKAKVVHYHRSTLSGFFKQQRLYAKYLFKIFFDLKYKFKGDHISTKTMIYQVPLLEAAILFFLLGPIFGSAAYLLSILSWSGLLLLYGKTFGEIDVGEDMLFSTILFSLTRTFAWMVGSIQGLTTLYFKKEVKHE